VGRRGHQRLESVRAKTQPLRVSPRGQAQAPADVQRGNRSFSALWAMVGCYRTVFVCGPCLAVVQAKWFKYPQRCKTCVVVGRSPVVRYLVP
jgi:hypothetical protein